VNNCLKGIKSQVKGYILIYKDEFSNEELNKRINSRRKFHEFVIFDENDNFVGQWESERSCNMDTGIDLGYIHNCLINNNSHKRKTKQKSVYKCFYLENCPEYLLNKKEEYTDGTNK
jgi:hypothetical protein